MVILAIDLGMSKSVACIYERDSGKHRFVTVQTSGAAFHDLVLEHGPDRAVIEVCPMAGWVHDLLSSMEVEVQVANPSHEGWRWKHVKRKTDRDDALKLAQLSSMNQLPTVYMPAKQVRQWRQLINYRSALVKRQTVIKNSIRSILRGEGLSFPSGKGSWTQRWRAWLAEQALSADRVDMDQWWRYQLYLELQGLADVEKLLSAVTRQLDGLAKDHKGVELLRTIPGVGARLAEALVAYLDRPERFGTGRQVSCYVGLTPRQFQSGQMDRSGRISKQGNSLLRSLLVEVSWLALRYNKRLQSIYARVSGPGGKYRKKAIVAVARHLLVWCWAMLRDGTCWRVEPV